MPSKKKVDDAKSEAPTLELQPELSPWGVLKQAIIAVPALKYALGILGIVSAIAIVRKLGVDYRVAVIGTIIVIVLMVALLIFEGLVKSRSKHKSISVLSLLWTCVVIFILSACLLFTSAFFDWPKPFEQLLGMTARIDVKPDISDKDIVIAFSQIEMADEVCGWGPIEKPCNVIAPIRNIAGKYWSFGGPSIGTPREDCTYGSHRLWPHGENGTVNEQLSKLLEDPVIDITIVNRENYAVILSRIGFVPIAAWTSPKGPPFAGKLIDCDGYILELNGFEPGKAQWLILDDPVYLAPLAPYRYRLQLKDYAHQVKRNESVISLLLEVNQHSLQSSEIYLGMYSVGG